MMKQFLLIVFGGLSAVALGVLAVNGVAMVIDYSRSGLLSALASGSSDGTGVSGLVRYVRYTASQEEDPAGLIDSAAKSLPDGTDGHITASAFLVEDLDSGRRVAEFNHDTLLPVASPTKLVTAVVARKLIPHNSRITLDGGVISTYGNTAGFKAGETFTADDLLHPLLMVSSNDAAEALARSYGRAKFIRAMNDFTQSLGAYRTYFADPSGLSPYNVSTADDLSIILDWIRKNDPYIISVTDMNAKTVRSHTWINPAHFLSWSNYLGGKNGYTDEAGETAAALFTLGTPKDDYAVIVLNSENRDADMIRLLSKVK